MKKSNINKKNRRRRRVRSRVKGGPNRPRLSVFRSNKHVYAQIIDDENGKTIIGLADSALKKESKQNKSERAKVLGLALAKLAKEAKIKKVVFDRGGRIYHGRIKSLAEGAREGGLEF
ncbi:MAG: 50S ribosomal protein L18 [Candidatus Niyogibacteria bacterium RIFCSPLOWO2_01_FULL_45_48]|uniref:Large ribosomal subunit protein uL18 n=2 Tax=Candidatus Niyogiibacteriota TaxID=1817912 RepID=A0A1G2F0B4_9BACT|nr:MAG: 50S ribosomal protein L18 [Candidatus Niyogibacteria bacterium RIFCSPHIGHO2_01_FULL_45_28]OGZ30733.1 MAG: 50S ribosomal protein L18 [Candidatus Niyogibacteria bacterium RIFCSPLOWO2_01_FULL_45_48]OGZ31182.1 MAG: 50S ribosomal protein L18 [Candidatus Niyogibacteria bacterium RIFCSPLOWO2_02_FULL_45_13]